MFKSLHILLSSNTFDRAPENVKSDKLVFFENILFTPTIENFLSLFEIKIIENTSPSI